MRSVLVVEDESSIAELLSVVLEEEGYQVRLARHGGEAWELLGEFRPTVILSDLMMPFVDGWELYHILRAHPEYRTIPLVILTAANHTHARGEDFPGARFIRKPFSIEEILDVVQELSSEKE